jgi:hypothetical protein
MARFFQISTWPTGWRKICLVLTVAAVIPTAGIAQDGALTSRAPEAGLTVLDCAPAAPAPKDACILRIPSGKRLEGIQSRSLVDDPSNFRIIRSQADLPGSTAEFSSTLVLIDLSRGPGNGRAPVWDRQLAGMRQMVENLPDTGEVAVYGFGRDLVRISDFSRSRSAVLGGMDGLRAEQNNTLISRHMLMAIDLLAQRERSIFKNLILISDGEEEGEEEFAAIEAAAIEAGVTVSVLGMFWRTQGHAETSRGLSVLRRISDPQSALNASIFLRDSNSVTPGVTEFNRNYAASVGRSGVIVPDGRAVTSQITATLREPVPGTNDTRPVRYQARFTPTTVTAPQEELEEPGPASEVEERELLFGFEPLYVYIAGGVGAALLLGLLAFFVLRRRDGEAEEEDDSLLSLEEGRLVESEGWLDNDKTRIDAVTPAPVTPPQPKQRPIAYLMRLDTGQRLPITGNRTTIGRSSTNGIVLVENGISRVHAEIIRAGHGGFSLGDLGSLNGTFLNGKKITKPTVIQIGDTVGLGKELKAKLVLP